MVDYEVHVTCEHTEKLLRAKIAELKEKLNTGRELVEMRGEKIWRRVMETSDWPDDADVVVKRYEERIAELEAEKKHLTRCLFKRQADAIREAVNQVEGLAMYKDAVDMLGDLLIYADSLEEKE